ncbi:MAG: hypothetical protein KatS3mg095_0447 [Candidatus Parcubacteria bacterium]|nr:MAG: hypothetical protein KatS3mg095_0447 [Candidatus Parcubacteria bacterium]
MTRIAYKSFKKPHKLLRIFFDSCAICKLFVAIFVVILFLPLTLVFAASIFLSPSQKTVNVGDSFNVVVYVESSDQTMNAVSFRLSFPNDLLKANNFSKSGSIINFWVQDPKILTGEISTEGVVLNPGYQGSAGKILTINFKALKEGTANLNFISGSVLANDGQGTNILKNLNSAIIQVKSEIKEEQQKEITPQSYFFITTPTITSPTHPNQNKWYNIKEAKLVWNLPENVNEAKTLLGQNPNAYPQVNYTPPISSKEIVIPYDGIWYFSLQFCNELGCSDIGRYRLQIDTTPPTISLKEAQREDLADLRVKIYIDANDNLSGIDYYLITIDGKTEKWVDDGSHLYQPKDLKPGQYEILVKGFDKAGNRSEAKLNFEIKPLEPPEITDYPKEVVLGEPVIIKGKSKYPNVEIYVYLEHQKGVRIVNNIKAKENGEFEMIVNDLSAGVYKAYAQIRDEIGRESLPSDYINIVIKAPYIIEIFGLKINIFKVLILLISLIIILVIAILYYLRKLNQIREKIEKETKDLHRAIHSFIQYLHSRFEEQIKLLQETKNKRGLTEEEEKILQELEEKIEKINKYLHKEIKDIEDIFK